MKGRVGFSTGAIALLGAMLFSSFSCVLSPQDNAETQVDAVLEEHAEAPGNEVIVCSSSEDIFTEILRSNESYVLSATPVSNEEAAEICYSYELYDENMECIENGHFKAINPRLEEELDAETESLGWGRRNNTNLALWTSKSFMGGVRFCYTSRPNLYEWSNCASSCIARGGVWLLYDGVNYNGRFIVCGRPYYNLKWIGFDNKISSVKIACVLNDIDTGNLSPIVETESLSGLIPLGK